ncbi:bacillithiol system protein YtxJ [Desulfosporosinus acidiphilus SJ4]|uniref:Bacillithiol system protein YtxJ n=1 Tax=Desulfosporosinus acidiphilus (strain DSM 22704 / JCM 16185 / SJ4) TaxID=646529 RepID=I4D6C6_DESAJ|nr:bacillithiol system redox-active protein YtxJ [Desulfosporosinus acidiphilus]AFM41350.1 bacillithiol system protein YtxJ [Desulfosporosinus acidiphilus SJ4]
MTEIRELSSLQEFEAVLNESYQQEVLLFKHSTQCPISARAWQEIQKFARQAPEQVQVAVIKVIESRSVSNQAERDLGIKHESPQILLIRNKKVVWHTSHQAVTLENILRALQENA